MIRGPDLIAAVELLRSQRSPELDAFRADVPAMLTSDVLGYLQDPAALIKRLADPTDEDAIPTEEILLAAALELGAEIDLRVPPRVPR